MIFDLEMMSIAEKKKSRDNTTGNVDQRRNVEGAAARPSSEAWGGNNLLEMPLLIKTKGVCSVQDIGNKDIFLAGAVNAFNTKRDDVLNRLNRQYEPVVAVAKLYQSEQVVPVIVGDCEFGRGVNGATGAFATRSLGIRVVLARSFSPDFELELKKHGLLPLTFTDADDYDLIQEKDHVSIIGMRSFEPEKPLTAIIYHADRTQNSFEVAHSFNRQQIEWFRSGSVWNG